MVRLSRCNKILLHMVCHKTLISMKVITKNIECNMEVKNNSFTFFTCVSSKIRKARNFVHF